MKQSIKFFALAAIIAIFFTSCDKKEESNAANGMEKSNTVSESENKGKSPIVKFSTADLSGKSVTNEIFEKYDVTLVNIWATWCPPCKAELPDLEKTYKKYSQQNCNVMAITMDVSAEEPEMLDMAKDILKDSGCSFLGLQNCNDFAQIISGLPGVPASFLVDKTGKIIDGSFHVGRLDEKGFEELFEKGLKAIK